MNFVISAGPTGASFAAGSTETAKEAIEKAFGFLGQGMPEVHITDLKDGKVYVAAEFPRLLVKYRNKPNASRS